MGPSAGKLRPPQDDKIGTARRSRLPVQLHGELELARIVGGCGLAGVAGGAAAERAHGGYVHFVCDIEHVGDQFQAYAFAEVDSLGNSHIVEHRPGLSAGVAAQIAVELEKGRRGQSRDEAVDARLLQRTRRRVLGLIRRTARGTDRGIGTAGEGRQLEVVSVAGDDVEWPTGSNVEQRGDRPVTEDSTYKAAAHLAGLVNAAEDKAVTLVEERGGTIEAGEEAVLRCERGLQIGGVVDGVRPRVGREEFVMLVEALAQVGGEAVVDRTAVGVVRVHVAEGDAAAKSASNRRSTTRVESLAGETALDFFRELHARDRGRSGSDESSGNRRIQASGTKEIHQRGINPGAERAVAARSGSAAYGERAGGGLSSGECGIEVGDHQVTTHCVGVDGAVQVTSAIEVVCQTESESATEIPFDGHIRLLRVGVDEVFGLGIAEGLESQRQECGRVQVVLIQKNGLREVESLKLLLVGKVVECPEDSRVGRWRAWRSRGASR